MTLAVFHHVFRIPFPLLDSKLLEDTIHFWAIFMPSVVIHSYLALGILWILYKYCFPWMGEATVRRRANKHGGTYACTYPWLYTRTLLRDSRHNLTPGGLRDLTPTPWSTAHKPHTPGWATQAASPFEPPREREYDVYTTPGQTHRGLQLLPWPQSVLPHWWSSSFQLIF